MKTLLEVRGIHHAYVKDKPVLADFSLAVEQGEIACLLGASGCGKTTALRIIAGFEKGQAGEVALAGTLVLGPGTYVPVEKRSVGIVFQDAALFPHLNVAKNIGFGLQALPKQQRAERVKEMLALVGLEAYADVYPHQLSGGQQQRIALARAMAPRPKLMLLDEPFSNLDASLRETLGAELRTILKANGMTAILVTHDQREAFAMADRVAVVHAGSIRQWDTPADLFQSPRDLAVAKFLGLGSFLQGESDEADTVRCALGIFQTINRLPAPGAVTVLIRPENVVPKADGVAATLRAMQFCGAYYRCDLELPQGERIQAWLPPESQALQVGAELRVGYRSQQVAAFPSTVEVA